MFLNGNFPDTPNDKSCMKEVGDSQSRGSKVTANIRWQQTSTTESPDIHRCTIIRVEPRTELFRNSINLNAKRRETT